MNYIEELQDVIRKSYGVESTHVKTVSVTEAFQGRPIWEGEVEVFEIEHPQTSRVFAWKCNTDAPDKPQRTVTVLQTPPTTTPHLAVQISIANSVRETQANAER